MCCPSVSSLFSCYSAYLYSLTHRKSLILIGFQFRLMKRSGNTAKAGIRFPMAPCSSPHRIFNRKASGISGRSSSPKSARLALVTSSSQLGKRTWHIHIYSIQAPFIQSAYGITNHLELVGQTSIGGFWANDDGEWTNDFGLGDTSIILKYRPIVQDPDSWVPSINWFNQVSLPTGKWAGTERGKDDFLPSAGFLQLAPAKSA